MFNLILTILAILAFQRIMTAVCIGIALIAVCNHQVNGYNPTTPDEMNLITELLPWDATKTWDEAGQGAVIRYGDSYIALFMVSVNDTRPVDIMVKLEDYTVMSFEVEVYPCPAYADEYRFSIDGIPAVAVIDKDSEFWGLVGTDVKKVYFHTRDGYKGIVQDVIFFSPSQQKVEFYKHSFENGWKDWLEVTGEHLGYILDHSEI